MLVQDKSPEGLCKQCIHTAHWYLVHKSTNTRITICSQNNRGIVFNQKLNMWVEYYPLDMRAFAEEIMRMTGFKYSQRRNIRNGQRRLLMQILDELLDINAIELNRWNLEKVTPVVDDEIDLFNKYD